MDMETENPGGVSAPTGTKSIAHCKAPVSTRARAKREALTARLIAEGGCK